MRREWRGYDGVWRREESAIWMWLMLAGMVALLIAGPYVACVAPCEQIMWLPVKDLPARCLPGARP